MKRILLSLVSLIAFSAPAGAHSSLDRSEPKNGATLPQSPNEIRIWFTEPIKPVLSTIEVRDAAGQQVDRGNLHADETNLALVHLSLPALRPGIYRVAWSIVAQDLHTTKGSFSFRVAP
jgi:methionine-rich copper-binding protein CopC